MATAKRSTLLVGVVLTGILVAANLIVFNLWFDKYDLRIDLTEDQRFKIGSGTQNIVDRLKDTVSIKCYFSSNIPNRFNHVERIVIEKLDEYEKLSEGKVIFEFVDPETNEEAKQECTDMGIQPTPVEEFENVSTPRNVMCYLAMVFRYGDRKVIFNLFQDALQSLEDPSKFTSDLEYFLTRSIRNVSTPRKTVGILANVQMIPDRRNPRGPQQRYQGTATLQAIIDRTHDALMVNPKDLDSGQLVPAEIDVLVVHKPTELDEMGLYAVDQFIMHGGRAIFLVDNGTVDFQPKPKRSKMGNQTVQDYDLPTYDATPIEHQLGPLLTHYGVRVEPQFVQDRSGAEVVFYKTKEMGRNFLGQVYIRPIEDQGPYASWPVVPARDEEGDPLDEGQISRQHSIMSPHDTFAFTWASPLTLLDENLGKHDARADVLIESGPRSGVAPIKDGKFSPVPDKSAFPPKIKQSVIAAMVTGRFRSYFKGKDIPKPKGTSGQELDPPEDLEKRRRNEAAEPGVIMVVGDADFVEDQTLQYMIVYEARRLKVHPRSNDPRIRKKAQSALLFVSNAVDVLCFGEEASDLFTLMNRVLRSREIKRPDDEERNQLHLINFGALPGVAILFGFLRFLFRRFRNRATGPAV